MIVYLLIKIMSNSDEKLETRKALDLLTSNDRYLIHVRD